MAEFNFIFSLYHFTSLFPLLLSLPQISLALVMQQTAEARSPSVKKFRDHITSVISDKHQPVITKSGTRRGEKRWR